MGGSGLPNCGDVGGCLLRSTGWHGGLDQIQRRPERECPRNRTPPGAASAAACP